jgi:hypothetical protein
MMQKDVPCDFCKSPIKPWDFDKGKAVRLLKRNYCERCMSEAVRRSKKQHASPAPDFLTPPAHVPPGTPPKDESAQVQAPGQYEHRRRHERKATSIAVELSIYLKSGQLYDYGTAILRDVSLSGALLGAVVLPGKAIPVEPHTVGLRVLEGQLRNFKILGRPVRFVHRPEGISIAVEFVKVEEAHLRKLRQIV